MWRYDPSLAARAKWRPQISVTIPLKGCGMNRDGRMLKVPDIEAYIQREFSSRLNPFGFTQVGQRKWVRATRLPIRHIFSIGAIGAMYCPSWGISSGLAPSFRANTFRCQTTDKNAAMDLIIDPIDETGNVPQESFGFITGYDTKIPIGKIRDCAEHFVPRAIRHFDQVSTLKDFCDFFLERSRLTYHRFLFENYTAHLLTWGFVDLLNGRRKEGIKRIRSFCASFDAEPDDKVLAECIRNAESWAFRF